MSQFGTCFSMNKNFHTVTEQVAQLLRDGMREGRWQGSMPGRNQLAAELGVNHKTTQVALVMLEQEGLLKSQGSGRKRSILQNNSVVPVARRIMILAYDKSDFHADYLLEIIHRLQSAGHWAGFATKTLVELRMDLKRVASFVEKTEADAWVVQAGRRDILEWFAAQQFPAFALFGRASKVPIASVAPEKTKALLELVNRLIELGHRRIVMIGREDRRKPTLAGLEQSYLNQLEAHGIKTSSYNLPDWGNDPDSLVRSLNTMFRHTPPTALIVDDTHIFPAIIQQLARLGISAPERVSLACTDFSPAFDWYRPSVTHIACNHNAVVKHVVKWVNQMSLGKNQRRLTTIKAEFILGGTIGPAPQNTQR
jgi:DNA-binding LacI/PurR family transcriptional regulator